MKSGLKNSSLLIVMVKGGLGNQLFCYAAGKALSLKTGSKLIVDCSSGFHNDHKYKRTCSLEMFEIKDSQVTYSNHLAFVGTLVRRVVKVLTKGKPLLGIRYLTEATHDSHIQVSYEIGQIRSKKYKILYLDGLWQSERFFSDCRDEIRRNLSLKISADLASENLISEIKGNNGSVALHVRCFLSASSDKTSAVEDAMLAYYDSAIDYVMKNIANCKIYVFSDNINLACEIVGKKTQNFVPVILGENDSSGMVDFRIMTQCANFIIANSTYSWWAAWFGENSESIIIAPDPKRFDLVHPWRKDGLVPDRWVLI